MKTRYTGEFLLDGDSRLFNVETLEKRLNDLKIQIGFTEAGIKMATFATKNSLQRSLDNEQTELRDKINLLITLRALEEIFMRCESITGTSLCADEALNAINSNLESK